MTDEQQIMERVEAAMATLTAEQRERIAELITEAKEASEAVDAAVMKWAAVVDVLAGRVDTSGLDDAAGAEVRNLWAVKSGLAEVEVRLSMAYATLRYGFEGQFDAGRLSPFVRQAFAAQPVPSWHRHHGGTP